MFNKPQDDQYKEPDNLNARLKLHKLYSTNLYGWYPWVFDQFNIEDKAGILEVGCGTADLWADVKNKVPDSWQIVFTDKSRNMVKLAKERTKDLKSKNVYRVMDCEEIPYNNNFFDAVIANHMIYHIPNKERALGEMARVLKPAGALYATTLGMNNMVELAEILKEFDQSIDYENWNVAREFRLETGGQLLSRFFNHIELRRYEDKLFITEPEHLVDYILSLKGFGNAVDIIVHRGVDEFTEYIRSIFRGKEGISITKDCGMFVAIK